MPIILPRNFCGILSPCHPPAEAPLLAYKAIECHVGYGLLCCFIVSSNEEYLLSLSLTDLQYLVIMSLLFIIELSVSIGALAITSQQQKEILKAGWNKAVTPREKNELQKKLDCCGFETKNFTVDATHPSCERVSIPLLILQNSRYSACGDLNICASNVMETKQIVNVTLLC